MYRKIAVLALAAASFTAAGAESEEAGVRQAFQAKFPKMSVESVSKTPFAGILEVVVGGDVYYTDAKVSYLLSGNLLDVRSGQPRNLTQETAAKLAAGALGKSTDLAVKRVRGNGKRVIYTFEDPNCGYCKEQQKELVKLNDVTIYTFLWPILSPDSVEKSKVIWCSKDRAKSWEDYMIKGVALKGKTDCDTSALERNAKLAQRFNLRGTPAIYIASGEQVGGYVPAEKLEAVLSGAPAR